MRLPQDWRSVHYRHWRGWIVGWLKYLSAAGTGRAIVIGAANREQEIGASSRPAHLLRLVHSPIDQKVRHTFGDRSANTQAGAIPLGVIDEPTTLTSEIAVDVKQRVLAEFGALLPELPCRGTRQPTRQTDRVLRQ